MKQIKVNQKVSEANEIISKDMKGVEPLEAFNTLIIGKETEKFGKKIVDKAKTYIENELTPDDVATVLEKDGGKKAVGEFLAKETLFGVEYEIGDTVWRISRGAKEGLINAANYSKVTMDELVKAGIIEHKLVVNYDKIHSILSTCKDKDDIPKDLVVLKGYVKLAPVGNTVTVSNIKPVK